VAGATFAYAAIFFFLGADRYATFHSGADLGLFVQTIASAFHGFRNTQENVSHFAFHFSPLLYLCAPLLWVTHSALGLVAIQALATSLVAPAIYAIARRRTSDWNAVLLACISLLYPPLQGVTFTDFHELAFAPAAVAWLLWAIDARRWAVAYGLLAVVLSIKEDQPPAMAFLGTLAIVYFSERRERRGVLFGLTAIVGSAVVFAGYFAIVRPLAGGGSHWVPSHFYQWWGYAYGQPLARQIAERLTYLLEVFLPLAFIPLRTRCAVLALPGLVEVLASREPLMYTMGQHYAGVWVPYVLVAFAVAGARLFAAPFGRRWVQASALLCILVLTFFSPLHLAHFLRPVQPQDAATEELIAMIPATAAVGTYDEIYAHLGFDPSAAIGLRRNPQYVVMDERYSSATWDSTMLPRLRRDVRSGIYRAIASRDGVTLFERR
jgi:uncharacterized membrane protein